MSFFSQLTASSLWLKQQISYVTKFMPITTLMMLSGFSMNSMAAGQTDLNGVKKAISQQQSSLTAQQKKLNALQQELKGYELSISKVGNEIRQTQTELEKTRNNLTELKEEKAELEQRQRIEQKKLSQLIQAYYVTDRSRGLTPWMRGDDVNKMDRIGVYFQHLAKQRADILKTLEKINQEIEDKTQQLAQEEEKQVLLLAEQQQRQNEIKRTQDSRKKVLAQINRNINSNQAKLTELRRNENRLKSEIAKAVKRKVVAVQPPKAPKPTTPTAKPDKPTKPSNSAYVPMNGLSRQRGKLPWPISGRVLHRYGTVQSGQITWKGVVIAAKEGQAVKSVYSGKVVFSQWLRGYGLVMLVNHGHGDMTLYGYNQALLKKEGDSVQAGETIAYAGNSGGQNQSALYFEVRRNSRTQNPKTWLKR